MGMLLVILIQSILLSVSCYISPFKSRDCSLLLSSRKNFNYNFKTLETEPHIVFLEYILYTRALEYRDKYTFSEHAFSDSNKLTYSHKLTEMLENINKHVLYPLNENDYYNVDYIEKEVEKEVEKDDEYEDEDSGFHEYSIEIINRNLENL